MASEKPPKEKKEKKNLYLKPSTISKAEKLFEALGVDDLSGLVTQLIIREWERRYGPPDEPLKPETRVSYVEDRTKKRKP
jgi:hypothetical protein